MPSTDPRVAPRWAAPVTLILSVAGLAASAYLTYEHFTASTTLACPDTGVVNCAKVTSSAQSALFGVPVAVLGMLFFIASVVANLPVAWRSRNALLRAGRVGALAGGVGMVAWLVYAELALIHAICLWCTSVHVSTVALFFATVTATAFTPQPDDVEDADDLDDAASEADGADER